MRENEKGSIVVETVGSFMFFVFLMVSIITLINITTVQARVHYAITQTANELAMYSYVIHALGLSEAAMSRDANAGAVEGQINSVINDINTIQSGVSGGSGGVADILGNLNTVIDAIGNLTTSAGSAASNPQAILFALVQYGLSPVMDGMMQEVIVRPMIAKHLQVGGLD
ncbi:MAG: hypothetical protein FWB75_00630, partial [Oscillospiraceae bacterium]|nr:hypothetical protein [Oscillospiraceae bacterium]